MASFATPTELAIYLQTATEEEATAGNPDLLDTARAQQLLDSSSAAIREVCRWNITQETVTTQPVRYWSYGGFTLPTLYLTALTLAISGVTWTEGLNYQWDRNGVVDFFTPLPYLSAVEVTYTHGYPTTPQAVKAVCVELAAAAYPNPSQYLSETIEGVSTVYPRRLTGDALAGGLDNDPRLMPYKLPPGIA